METDSIISMLIKGLIILRMPSQYSHKWFNIFIVSHSYTQDSSSCKCSVKKKLTKKMKNKAKKINSWYI